MSFSSSTSNVHVDGHAVVVDEHVGGWHERGDRALAVEEPVEVA
jgi:hypothetical protein